LPHAIAALRKRGFFGVEIWSKSTLRSLLVPGGVLLLLAEVLLSTGWIAVPAYVVQFSYYAVFVTGILLSWRFHSSRVLLALLTLFLAHRAVEFFAAGPISSSGSGHIALEAVAVLLPLNFIAFSFSRERGLSFPAILPALAMLFFESVFVAVICRPGEATAPAFLHPAFWGRHLWSPVSQLPVFAFVAAFAVLLTRFLLYRKPVESGLLWSLAAAFLSLEQWGTGRTATGYMGAAGLILVSSIVENSYLLAYHDELTGLRARRAFNDALLRLEKPYAIAAVDIDHFKSFNDTYGHDTGDQVLRMVAARLARVSGGGQAYRVGGEEFSILFPGRSMAEVIPYVELLRKTIEAASFQVRGSEERRRNESAKQQKDQERRTRARRMNDRAESEEGDRRRSAARKSRKALHAGTSRQLAKDELSVTVSIGVAEPARTNQEVEQVIQAADKALYRAKQAGRNRVEAAMPGRSRARMARQTTASGTSLR
jgi:diguanylate cyclase (GGDEF)-like protein